ncbi:MAG: hypothetical protein ABSD47_04320 [Candidatus Methylomirabilota bacterium]|jgi:hypothetical protein
MKRKKVRKAILLALLGILACCGVVLAVLFLLLHSPSLLNRLANTLGYELSAQSISLSPNLSGSISGLSIKSLGDDRMTLVASNVTAKNSLDMILQGEVDSLVLQNPKLTFRIGKQKGGPSDLSFLKRLPGIRLLDIRNAEARFPFEGGQQQVELTGINLTIKDFSSKTGGSIAFQAHFAFQSAGDPAIAASGNINGNFRLAGVYPRPYGKGTVEVAVDSGKYASGGRTISLSGLTLAADMAYDQPTESFAITALRGASKNFGSIQGTAKAVLRGEVPWSAACSLASIDFAQVFDVIKPLLPEEYHAWTLQGTGAVETRLQGTYASDRPSLNGSVTFSFNQGGFSSPDSTKAAQGVSGRIILKLQYAPEQKLTFNIRSEQADGEYLWGKFYSNLSGQKASLAADGTLFFGRDPRFDLNGSLDVFQTGEYSFSADGTTHDWGARITVAGVSHEALLQKLLKDYLKELSPGLATLSITGTSSLETVIRHDRAATSIAGTYLMAGATLKAPDMPLDIQEIAVDLPFDLVSPSSGRSAPSSPARPGFIRFKTIQRKRLSIDDLQIPLTIAQNTLDIPEPVVVPFFGGHIRLYGVQVDDVLSPVRNRFGVKIENVDLGRMTRRLMGTEYPGTINADLGVMHYENNRIASEGRAVIHVFGGEIEATNFFAENITASSRRFGGDITFRNINLEEVTRKIAIGKMAGIIQGSLKNLVVEYGQPASFTLEVESVEARGITQQISMDAIQNISILGTGAGSALNRGITQFFKEYPYSKIGFRCVLNNDQFSVNGTIHEDGKEYLVRRGFLRGVDVVNQNPNNVISFKDMEERTERIFRSPQAEPVGVEFK